MTHYELLNSCRKSRNYFVHNGKVLDEEKVRPAVEALFKLISLAISNYRKDNLLDEVVKSVFKYQRGDLYPEKTSFSKDKDLIGWHCPSYRGIR